MTNPSQQIAETILQQLGGSGRLSAMIGAHTFLATGDGLQFALKAQNPAKVKTIIITLDPSDTYTVKYYGRSWSPKGEDTGIYADSLRETLERKTGLYLSLGTMGR